jgi:hypothetical protein
MPQMLHEIREEQRGARANTIISVPKLKLHGESGGDIRIEKYDGGHDP